LGTGPNSIRLWETMSYGTIPVILSNNLVLPVLDNDYKRCMIVWDENEIDKLYDYLENFDEQLMSTMSLECIYFYRKYFSPENMHLPIMFFFDNFKI
jgi:hypothetical protein